MPLLPELFRLQPFGIKQFFKSLKPNRQEAIALSVLLIISLLLPVQSFLLQRRVLVRDFNHIFEVNSPFSLVISPIKCFDSGLQSVHKVIYQRRELPDTIPVCQ